MKYPFILYKWFVISNLIGWWRSHGCSAFFQYCTVNSLLLNLWRQWRRRRWRRTKMASTVRRIWGEPPLGQRECGVELAWGEPLLGQNVWHPGESIIFEELSPADVNIANLENSVAELRSEENTNFYFHFSHYLRVRCVFVANLGRLHLVLKYVQ